MSHRVLVVDDEPRMRDLITLHLKGEFHVESASSGEEALKILAERPFDVVILDVLMPGKDGWEVCQEIRRTFDTPVIMLTALSGVEEKLEAFASGADDYVTKPFDARELVARIKALLRRKPSEPLAPGPVRPPLPTLQYPGLTVDPERRQVMVKDRQVSLTPMEFELLYFLGSHAGRVFTREELLQAVWKDEAYAETRTVDSHIKTLREKLGRDGHGKWLVTVWGVGYKFEVG